MDSVMSPELKMKLSTQEAVYRLRNGSPDFRHALREVSNSIRVSFTNDNLLKSAFCITKDGKCHLSNIERVRQLLMKSNFNHQKLKYGSRCRCQLYTAKIFFVIIQHLELPITSSLALENHTTG